MDHYSNDRFARRGIMNHSNEPSQFKLHSEYQPTGDQPQAIAELVEGFRQGNQFETLLGVTGSGKTFTMANVIQALNKPTLIIAHNKTLAGQLYGEMKEFFPENAVEYFVSYYDYYQPEAYVPSSDTYIAKDSSINDEIDKLRLSATASLAERRDVVVVASVSCIYGLGSPDEYQDLIVSLRPGMVKDRDEVLRELIDIQYNRNDMDIQRATFRVRGDVVEVYPAQGGDYLIRIEFFGDEIDRIAEVEPLTGKIHAELNHVAIFPASHYVVSQEKIKAACDNIEEEMKERVQFFKGEDKLISFLDAKGSPSVVERAMVLAPCSRMGPVTEDERNGLINHSPVYGKYEDEVDRESAYEMLQKGVQASTEQQNNPPAKGKEVAVDDGILGGLKDILFGTTGPRGGKKDGVVQTMAKSAARQVTNQIVRGMLGSLLGGRKR